MSCPLLPAPTRFERVGGTLSLTDGPIECTSAVSGRVRQAIDRVPFGGFHLSIHIDMNSYGEPQMLSSYEYELTLTAEGVSISAVSEWGVISALSALRQLKEKDGFPLCRVRDLPRYRWRGLMIDTARHFIPLETLRQQLDLMEYFRLNVLHLHLTDDQAFRFESEAFPDLASEEHYTAAELSELVSYAADRAIRVVPELDVPGHTTSWLLAHPEWGTQPVPGPSIEFGQHDACLDPSNPAVTEALGTLLKELGDVFPDECVHIGGDEVADRWWSESAAVQEFMRKNGILSYRDLQAEFTAKLVDLLRLQGKTAIAWDEALHAGLAQTVIVQAWRGRLARDAALYNGHRCIVSSPYYLDLGYPADIHYSFEPEMSSEDYRAATSNLGNDIRLRHAGRGVSTDLFDWAPEQMQQRPEGMVIGGEACMWTELVSADHLPLRVWSRMPAIAERLWGSRKSEADLYPRMHRHYENLRQAGYGVLGAHTLDDLPAELQPLIAMLEPVKWYSRILGSFLAQARSQGSDETKYVRPYNTTTPLQRVVDHLPPESFEARRCADDIVAGRDLNDWVEGWLRQGEEFDRIASSNEFFRELSAASQALARIGSLVAEGSRVDESLAGPYGEYILPIAFTLSQRDS